MKRIRTNRRRRMKLKNFIACVTALSVVMGSSYFALAEEVTYCGYPADYNHAQHTGIDGDCYEMQKAECDGNGCYELTCEMVPLHGHTNDCYEKELKCGVTDEAMAHVHDDATCDMVPDYDNLNCQTTHEHDTTACADDCSEGHEHDRTVCPADCDAHHTDDCYGKMCGILPKGHGNEHTDACYNTKKICDFDYDHDKHDFDCFTLRTANEPEPVAEDPAADPATPVAVDEPASADAHEGDCYKPVLTCKKDEHAHSAICYISEEEKADVDKVKTAIEALTTASENVGVEDARHYYNELNDRQKAVVNEAGLDVKLAALEVNLGIVKLPALEAAVGSDLYDAKQLRDKLNGLVDKEAYDASFVPNKAALDAYNGTLDDAEAVIDAIEDLPAVDKYNSNDKADVTNAYDAYTALDANERELVKLVDSAYVTKLFDLVAQAVDVYQIATDQVPGATVKVFNYTDDANGEGLGLKGYNFTHGNYIKVDAYDYTAKDEAEKTNQDKKKYGIEGSVDGTGKSGFVDYGPVLDNVMSKDYPYPYDSTKDGGMDYLFADSSDYYKGTMQNGGGLFQLKGGYYTYDSSESAAYFNGDEFEVYNVQVVPFYSDYNGSHKGNFLPFNPVEGKDANGKAYIGIENQYGAIDGTGTYNVDIKDADGNVVNAKGSAIAKHDNYEKGKTYVLSETNPTDNWFGMTVEFDFLMPKDGKMNQNDMVFNFSGDDDVFVYIDNKLVLDIGGCHPALPGSINFATGEVSHYPRNMTENENLPAVTYNMYTGEGLKEGDAGTSFDGKFDDYTTHNFKFFYMERGGNISNCKISFNMPTLPENSLLIGKDVVVKDHTNGLALAEELASTLEYNFRVLDENGDVLVKDTNYSVLDDESYEVIRTGRVNADNNQIITLHPGELAQIENMPAFAGGDLDTKYYVEELIPKAVDGQYESVEVKLGEASGEVTDENKTVVDNFIGYKSGEMNTGETLAVTFVNNVDVESFGKLQITKTVTDDSWSIFDKEFEFMVKLNGEKLSNDIQYTVTGESTSKNVSNDGTIKLKKGQTATIDGIMAGTEYEVYEVETKGFTPTYTRAENVTYTRPVEGDVTGAMETVTDVKDVVYEGKVEGALGLKETVSIGVENESKEFELPVSLQKTAENIKANDEFEFYFDVVEVDAAGEEIEAQFDMREAVEEDEHDVTVDEDNMITVPFAGPEYTPSTEPDCKCEEIKEEALKKAQDTENIVAEAGGREPEVITEVTVVTAKNGHAVGCPVATYVPSEEPAPETMSKPAELIFKFDENTESGLHYFKVTERIPNASDKDAHFDRFVYDDTVYIITIDIQQTARGERAKFVSLTADGKVITGVTADDLPLIDFTNRTPRDKDDDTYLTVKKVWNDNGNEGNTRPDSITVKLLKDGKEYSEVEVTRKGGWTYTWSNLDDDYTWTVEEVDTVDGYDNTSMETSASGHTVTITNTLDDDDDSKKDPEDPKDPPKDTPKDPSDPDEEGDVLGIDDENVPKGDMVLADEEEVLAAETGDSNHALAALAAMIAALAGIVLLKKRKAN